MPFWKQIDEKTSEAKPTQGNVSDGSTGDIEAGIQGRRNGHHEKQPTDRVTGHQLFYIFGLDGIGAAILSGGINFAIAYGMYATQNVDTHPIRLFQLPNTLAGDAVVTIVIQTLVTWFVELVLVDNDLRNGAIRPVGFIREPTRPLLRWLMLLEDVDDAHAAPARPGGVDAARSKRWPAFLADQAIRVGLIFVVAFFLLWLPAVGILTAVGERRGGGDWDWYFRREWAPEIFKGVFGGLLALFTTPAMASFWLVREGWRLRRGGAVLS